MRTIKYLTVLVIASLSSYAIAQLEPRPLGSRSLGSLTNSAQEQRTPLPLHEAFPYYVSEVAPGQLEVSWNPAPGHYLYRHAFHFSLQLADDSTTPVEFSLPDGLKKTDPFFGDIEAYYGNITADVTLPVDSNLNTTLLIEYQGCADWGFCYPPQRARFQFQP